MGVCGLRYQLVDNTEIFRAATASGGDLVKYFVDEEECIGDYSDCLVC